MLAYAASRPVVAERRPAPHAMLGIIAGHVAVVALVMSAKMDLPERIMKTPLVVELLPEPDPPADPLPQPKTPARAPRSMIDRTVPLVPTPTPDIPALDVQPTPLDTFEKVIGPSILPLPQPVPQPRPAATIAQLLTPASELRPPYPASKIASGEEAVLRLRLSIDERGRVVAIEPVGAADRAFLEAARRHLLARWRYKPATEAGRPVASSKVITLRFQLDG